MTKLIMPFNTNNRFLPRYFQKRRPAWRKNNQFDQHLLIIAATCMGLSLCLLLIGGLQTGFWPLYNTGKAILPPVAWANITFIGDTYTALAITLLFSYRFPHITTAILISALAGTLMIHGFKHIFNSPRPPALLLEHGLEIIGPTYKRNSFPSGHTATAFILATLLTRCVNIRWKKIAILLCAGLIAWSRIACGVHWPADVFAGAALGITAGWIGIRAADNIKLNVGIYSFVLLLLAYAAITLFDFDGDFATTSITAQIIGFSSLFYCGVSWLFELSKPLLRQLNNNMAP